MSRPSGLAIACMTMRAVFGVAADRAEPILRPRQRHHAVAADAAERRTQPGQAAARRRAQDRSARLGADAERRRSPPRSPTTGRPTIRSSPASDPTGSWSGRRTSCRRRRARRSPAWRSAPRRPRAASRRRSRRSRTTCSLNAGEPHVVLKPLTEMMSFAPHGMPCSGPLYLPAAISASARFASARP